VWKHRQRLSLADLGPTGSGSTAFAVNANGDVTGVSNGLCRVQVVSCAPWFDAVAS
jgi:hypothetical protein